MIHKGKGFTNARGKATGRNTIVPAPEDEPLSQAEGLEMTARRRRKAKRLVAIRGMPILINSKRKTSKREAQIPE